MEMQRDSIACCCEKDQGKMVANRMRVGASKMSDTIVLQPPSQKGCGVGCRVRSECGHGGSGRDYPECISCVRDCAMERPYRVS